MSEYLVTWKIDVEAPSPREAAEAALKVQRDKESTATVFSVRDKAKNTVEEIDVEMPEERTWNTWVLSQEDIEEVARENELSLEGRDLGEIARNFEKGVSALLGSGYDWTMILEEAIRNTEPEAQEEA